jgi:YcaO-like protein with predicted kinase domain
VTSGSHFAAADPGNKRPTPGTDRTISPEETLARVRHLFPLVGITRVANLTGLDHIGVPVTAAYRPNARAIAVSQGKGLTLAAAKASCVMEAIETFHAERMTNALRAATLREMLAQPHRVNAEELPRTDQMLDLDAPMLWTMGRDLLCDRDVWVPWEVVHTDYTRSPLVASGMFACTSNGLASGNHPLEATSHGVCEVVERDANALFHVSPSAWQQSRRIDLATMTSGPCRELLDRFSGARVVVMLWEATSDVGIPSFICRIADADERGFVPVIPISGSGCHPRREIAALRAMTEAAQGRITRIASAREDLADGLYDPAGARAAIRRFLDVAEKVPTRSFAEGPDFDSRTVAGDVAWELERLASASLRQVVVVDLTRPELGVPVVRVVVPGLEGTHEHAGLLPGARQRQWQSRWA